MAEAKQGRTGGPPDFPTLLQRAEALVPVLRERAAKAEEIRRLPDETIEDLHRSGLFRILQPKRVGGSELPFRSIVDLVSAISRGDGSTGWVLANLAAHHWLLGMWPKQAQDEIWGESPDNLIGSALIFPRGRAKPVPGGYRLSGRWPFSSGVDAATWSLIGAIVLDPEAGLNEPRIFVLPASDFTIIDTWHVIGLAGTGSKDVAVDDVFVPEYRTVAVKEITGGPNPGSAVNPSVLYQLPAISLFPFCIGGVSLGIAQGAIEYFTQTTKTRTSYYTGRNLADFVTLQIHLGEAGAIVDAARAVMLSDCEEATRLVGEGVVPSLDHRARYRRDGAYAATLCTKAVDLLFQATGGGAIYARNPLQRAFRDAHAANAHYVLNWDINGAMYGRVALGLSPDATL
ncbi:MAG: acyl-CoA dehydrogenase [Alphaproteobacteria bacterium]|nr:acyl-CoA dehydrogenase [Alphaproteobacteria bacterium]MBV9150210.1 acyl-CoA dehydrogenase [Alphaproteobacteria bacterium]MBV9584000.1 acyl-CoA dehydrogenase [Alphaproteobacteria bacterium]MBV9964184.1 acyl-CoA dehydrogenase [Alphaproteobacteria bacterium]